MLGTRLVVGSLLAALILGVLLVDDYFAPWYPVLFATIAGLGLLSCHELLQLLPAGRRPASWLCHCAVLLVIAANWARVVHDWQPSFFRRGDPWLLIVVLIAATLVAAFLREMAVYREPGEATVRVALTGFVVIYLGVLASFLLQVRWLAATAGDERRSTHALLLTIFVPKCCDVGAYCAGRLFGRHRMTPLLSPKKTWEGAAGGFALAVIVALAVSWFGGQPAGWYIKAVLFGLVVAAAGMLGDLAESLIKREGQKKDASQSVPGFGGVLDVVDSLLFAAPVAYLWLTSERISPL